MSAATGPATTLMRTLATLALLASLVVAGAGGALAGMRLAARVSAPAERTVTIAAPELTDEVSGAVAAAFRSAAGFTGFGGLPALRGDVLRSGVVQLGSGQDTPPGALTILEEGAHTAVRYRSADRLFRIAPGRVPLAAGDVVLIRVVEGVAVGVLRVPADLQPLVGAAAGNGG